MSGKYTIGISGHFDSAHFLKNYPGACSNLHGHTWKVDIIVSSKKLDEIGMAIDFKILKKLLNNILDKYDHHLINDIEPFKNINPTAENISREIYVQLKTQLEKEYSNAKLESVTVWESQNAFAKFEE